MTVDKYADLITGKCRLNPFALSIIFARRPKGVGKKQGWGVLAFVVLLSDKDRLSTGAIEPVL